MTTSDENSVTHKILPWGRSFEEYLRISAMKELLADFPAGTREGRYVVVALPGLPFRSQQFGIALCSHFLCRRFKRHLF